MRSQKQHGSVGEPTNLFVQRGIVTAFLGMTKHLKSRPQPRATFDEVAIGRHATPGLALIRAARSCLSAAAAKDETTLAATRGEVAHFFDTLKREALRDYEPRYNGLAALLSDFAKESSEAHVAVTTMALQCEGSDGDRLLREVSEAVDAGARVLQFGPRIALPSHPISMGAVR